MNLPKNKFSLLLGVLLCCHPALVFAERGDREKPIQMEADRVTVDDLKQVSTFEGRVQMRQGSLLIEANKIIVSQDKKGYSQVHATGQLAHFRQKRDGTNEYAEGFGERIEYDSHAEIANIFGQARVKRDGDDVNGDHIIYNTQTGVFQVFGKNEDKPDLSPNPPPEGRVTIIIQPKNQAASAVPTTQTHPDKSTNLPKPLP